MKRVFIIALLFLFCLPAGTQDILPVRRKAPVVEAGGGGDACGTGNLLFAWHCENVDVTLGTPAGCSLGDTVATLNSGAVISTTQEQDGSNSLSVPTINDRAIFAVTGENIAEGSQGRIEFYLYVTTIASTTSIMSFRNGANAATISMGSNFINLEYLNSGSPDPEASTTAGSLTTGSWLKVVAQWRTTGNPNLRVTVNDANEGTVNDDPGAEIAPTEVWVGEDGGGAGGAFFVDNIKIYSTYE